MPNPLERSPRLPGPRLVKQENGILYADPAGSSASAGIFVDKKTITEFGEGDYFYGSARIFQYLIALFREHGTILPALGIENAAKESASRMMGFENANSQEEIQAWSRELQGRDVELVGELLNKVEAWEKSRRSA